ncbi:MAG: hypothetical protein EB170_04245, partial [Nitrosopumilaceae archaeon]|nr:hypothetical protein [Nitrosopumilaceae archaeon]
MKLFYGILASFILLSGTMTNAEAQTYKIYVQQIPQMWKKTFDQVLPNAFQYWKQKNPDVSFELTKYPDPSDFVIEWSSQFDESKTGHYSSDTENYYDKPKFTVPLAYLKAGKLKTVSPEFATEIAKHNLGHAMGLSHSDDPKDIMYPQIENYESWMKVNTKVSPKNTTGDWKPKAEKLQAQLGKKIDASEAKFSALIPSINSTWTTNKASEAEMKKAQNIIFVGRKLVSDAESFKVDGDDLLSQAKYS